jgi:hypothetical protein
MNCSAAAWLPSRPTQPALTLDHPLNPTDSQYRFGGASNAAEQRDGHILITSSGPPGPGLYSRSSGK